jgi:hypothetical protein
VAVTDISHVVVGIARVEAQGGGRFLGTGFGVSPGLIATCLHNVGGDDRNLRIVAIDAKIDEYQDATNSSFMTIPVRIKGADSLRDICLLELVDPATTVGSFSRLLAPDSLNVGEPVSVFGYPHSTDAARVVLTRQDSIIGAKVLLDSGGVKAKHLVVNLQARPGQSGGPVISARTNAVVAMVMGSFAPAASGGLIIGGIDPQTLHQTTHAISAEYIAQMVTNVQP